MKVQSVGSVEAYLDGYHDVGHGRKIRSMNDWYARNRTMPSVSRCLLGIRYVLDVGDLSSQPGNERIGERAEYLVPDGHAMITNDCADRLTAPVFVRIAPLLSKQTLIDFTLRRLS